MVDKKTKDYIIIGLSVVAVIAILIVFVPSSNNDSQNYATCNSPYIKVGNSCCLDQNYNSICDNDEQKLTLICKKYSLSLDIPSSDKSYVVYILKNPNDIPLTFSCNWVLRIWENVEDNKKIIETFDVTIPANWEISGEKDITLSSLPDEGYHHVKLECQDIEDIPECWN